jgi:hypothetical protein
MERLIATMGLNFKFLNIDDVTRAHFIPRGRLGFSKRRSNRDSTLLLAVEGGAHEFSTFKSAKPGKAAEPEKADLTPLRIFP